MYIYMYMLHYNILYCIIGHAGALPPLRGGVAGLGRARRRGNDNDDDNDNDDNDNDNDNNDNNKLIINIHTH